MKKLKVILTLCIALCMLVTPMATFADVPYKTYTQNGYGDMVKTQTAYISEQTIIKFGDYTLGAAQDLKITDDDVMYICDSGNASEGITPKIIIYDIDAGEVINVIEEKLVTPTGVFVTEGKEIYVADQDYYATDEGAIVVFDATGKKLREYGKPDSPLYGNNVKFSPQKVAVADGGTMYISCAGNTNGLAQIAETEGGTFLGYFGTNATNITLYQRFLKLIGSSGALATKPASISNVSIDDKGLIYTLTPLDSAEPVKKLNIAGTNLMLMDIPALNASSVAVGAYENVYVASTNYIYEYTKEGSLLFMFGGADNDKYRKGLFRTIGAIDVDSKDKIYTLDTTANEVQIFVPTEFTDLVHESLTLYQKGAYTESKEPLEQIIRMNGLFDYANLAMAQALFQEEDYSTALEYFRLAKDKEGYSDAFWEVRNVWLNEQLVTAVIVIVAIIVAWKLLKKANEKWAIFAPVKKVTNKVTGTMLWKRVFYGFTYMRHPMDGAYNVKRKGMQSYSSAAIIMVVLIIFNIISKYFCGFLVKNVRDGRYEIPTDIAIVVVGFLFISGCTYLITCINDGEGKFKDTLQAYLYSFGPYFAIQPIIYIAGLVVTNNEMFFIEFANIAMLVWIAILVVVSIMEINNYSFKETVKVIFLTIFAAFIFAVAIFIMYVLTMQVVNFITSVYGEVVYRIGS
ncbi:MAG: hypothetical protein E7269_08370 [Lachnospiraceae bacterium]|nr:hypothetical protein [Lachnospiraceae bacterium]